MATVEMTDWEFSLDGSPPSGGELKFKTALDLLIHLARNITPPAALQSRIQNRLKVDPTATSWHRERTLLKHMPYFLKYRGRHYDSYHTAARAVANGNSTALQQQMTMGLNQEIAASKVIASKGQVLFHGRADLTLHKDAKYPSFISTSLDPVVAMNSALRRAGNNQVNGRPVVYLLTLLEPLTVIWGGSSHSCEWELLLETNLSCVHLQTHYGTLFDIVEATIGHQA